jgi:hypothetical protein
LVLGPFVNNEEDSRIKSMMMCRAFTKILVTHEFMEQLEMHMFAAIVTANTT